MIARHGRGWTEPADADASEAVLKDKVLPGLREVEGYKGGYVLRRDAADEVEFLVLNLFDSLESVKRFAGPDFAAAVFEPEAKTLLRRIEPTATHYEVLGCTVSNVINTAACGTPGRAAPRSQ